MINRLWLRRFTVNVFWSSVYVSLLIYIGYSNLTASVVRKRSDFRVRVPENLTNDTP